MKRTHATSTHRMPFMKNRWLQGLFILFITLWIYTFTGTPDRANWYLENALVFVFIGFLFGTYRKYKFSDVSYTLIFIYLSLHVYGAMYTYAENPFGFWLQEVFHASRNHYDRIVHFSFGFLLAYPMREMFLVWLRFPKWVAWSLPIEVTLSVSAFYELIEWAVADIFFKSQGHAYLGTQGDIWDAQKDIFLAFSGAILATTIVSLLRQIFKGKLGLSEV